MKRFRWALSAAIVAAAGMGLAWIAYRAYAPGSLSDRIARAQQRWSVFGEPTTWSFLGRGLGITAQLAAISVILSLTLAVPLALARLSRHPRLRAPFPGAGGTARVIGLLVETVRSSPLFMLIIYTFIAAPKVGLDLTPFWAGVSALTLYTSCVTSEIVRAGILSLERGQFEAAEALGLGYVDRLRFVVLPQALRRMVPAIVSQLVTLIKDTSLVSFITVVELARRGQILEQTANNPIETSLVLMAMYFVVNFALSEISRRLELRPGRAGRARPPASIGTEDQIPAVVEPTRP
ncbi:MAG TPA: amino acid ABC transporter permease [Actinomycetota bacterium]|jgi:putative glutamine transport system permease protein|nr:amino acid ABC transporter permease [Actinomycetota bacterium]